MVHIADDLIYDIGLNDGEDSEFYLKKGFRVVAVEANPVLVEAATKRLGVWIDSGKLTILSVGIGSEFGTFNFYRNLEEDQWSSFDPKYGCRNGTKFEVVAVPCVPLYSLFEEHGVPRYSKIDIEGADKAAISSLKGKPLRPCYISTEEYGVKAFADLRDCGYNRFQLVRQRLRFQTPPDPALEGNFAELKCTGSESGLFGRELSGPWLSFEDCMGVYGTFVRRDDFSYVGPPMEWFDIHATTQAQLNIEALLRS